MGSVFGAQVGKKYAVENLQIHYGCNTCKYGWQAVADGNTKLQKHRACGTFVRRFFSSVFSP